MKSLDPESKKFISWAVNELNKEEVWASILLQVRRELEDFLSQPPSQIIDKVHYKLIRGGLEHGVPIYTSKQVMLELDDELKDLIGWILVGRYNKLLKAKSA